MVKKYFSSLGFKVRFSRSHLIASVFDGDELFFRAHVRSFGDYFSEVKLGENECAVICGYFFTDDGTKYIHWCDTEECVDFITEAIAVV